MILSERICLADKIQRLKRRTAETVTESFFEKHPDLSLRYGARWRELTIEDAGYHIEFLAGSIVSGDEVAFGDYLRWASKMLEARGIAPAYLAENLEQIERALAANVDAVEHRTIATFVRAGLAELTEELESETARSGPGLALSCSVYVQAILRGDRRAAEAVVAEAMRHGSSTMDIYIEVFQTALYEVGREWENGKIPVATEHMATAITQTLMAQVYSKMSRSTENRGGAVITGVQNELHQIGGNMVADLLDANGWDVRFLGSNAPHAGILAAIEEHKPNLLGISVTVLFNLPELCRLVADVRSRFPQIRIIVGGAAFRSCPSLWREVGADGYGPDLRSVLEVVDRIAA